MTTVQPHAIWALAWSSKLVSLRCRRRRTADEVSAYGRTFGIDGGTGLGTYSQFRAPYPVGSSHLWGPCHDPDLPVYQLVCTKLATAGGQQDWIVSCGESVQTLQSKNYSNSRVHGHGRHMNPS